MRKLISYIILSVFCFAEIFILSTVEVHAQESQKVMTFLSIPTSSHAAALGGDNISIIEDDATLAYSNPSLLASVSSKSISVGYMNYMSGVHMATASYVHVLSKKATIGGFVEYINYGTLQQRDANNNYLGNFTPSDFVIEPLFSYTLSKYFVGGIGAKFIYSKIGDYSSTAAAVDLGINYYHPDLDISASLAVKNLGGQLSAYNDEYEGLPIDLQTGVSYKIPKMPFRPSLTFVDLIHWDYAFYKHMCLGLDVIILPEFYIAAGYNFRRASEMTVTTTEGETSGGAGWTVGAGLQLNRFSLQVTYGKFHVSSSSIMGNISFRL